MPLEDRLQDLERFYLDEAKWTPLETARRRHRIAMGTATADDFMQPPGTLYLKIIEPMLLGQAEVDRFERLELPFEPPKQRHELPTTETLPFQVAAHLLSFFPDEPAPPILRQFLEACLHARPNTEARMVANLCVAAMGGLDHQRDGAQLKKNFAMSYLDRLGRTDVPLIGRYDAARLAGCRRRDSGLELRYGLLPDACYNRDLAQQCPCQHEPPPPEIWWPYRDPPEGELHEQCYDAAATALQERADLIDARDNHDVVIVLETPDELRDRIWRAFKELTDAWGIQHPGRPWRR